MASIFRRKRKLNGTTAESGIWYVRFMDHRHIQRMVSGYSDKRVSAALGDRLDRLVTLRMAGEPPDMTLTEWLDDCPMQLQKKLVKWDILPPERMNIGKQLAQHVEDWKSALLAKGTGCDRAHTSYIRTLNAFKACGFQTWGMVDAVRVAQQLSDWRNSGRISTQTSNHYVQSMKQFCKWMVDNRRATVSPLRLLTKITVTSKRRELVRRALTDGEFMLFVNAPLNHSTSFKGLDGFTRATMYITVRRTGLRWSELRSLCRSAFELTGRTPKVYIQDDDEKHPRGIPLPLKEDAVEMLKKYFAFHPGNPDDKAFPMPSRNVGAEVVRHDLELAGIPYRNEEGLVFDFHAIRGQLATDMARAGIPPQKTQKAMRHGDINLTMRYYTHLTTEDQRSALEQLPPMKIESQSSGESQDEPPETAGENGSKNGLK